MNIQHYISKWGDSYDREARLYPSLLTILPMLVFLMCVFGAKHPLLMTGVSLIVGCGGPLLLSRIARDLGKKLEDRLYLKWGGKPTTILLRHRDLTINAFTKKEYHNTISLGIEKNAPTVNMESKNPDSADTFYRAGTVWLITKTQDIVKHSLVFRENKNYGFQRNLRGLKWIGILVSSTTLLLSLGHFYLNSSRTNELVLLFREVTIVNALPMITSGLMLLCFIFLVTENSVKRAGFAYADRLIRSCDVLGQKAKKKKSEV